MHLKIVSKKHRVISAQETDPEVKAQLISATFEFVISILPLIMQIMNEKEVDPT